MIIKVPGMPRYRPIQTSCSRCSSQSSKRVISTSTVNDSRAGRIMFRIRWAFTSCLQDQFACRTAHAGQAEAGADREVRFFGIDHITRDDPGFAGAAVARPATAGYGYSQPFGEFQQIGVATVPVRAYTGCRKGDPECRCGVGRRFGRLVCLKARRGRNFPDGRHARERPIGADHRSWHASSRWARTDRTDGRRTADVSAADSVSMKRPSQKPGSKWSFGSALSNTRWKLKCGWLSASVPIVLAESHFPAVAGTIE